VRADNSSFGYSVVLVTSGDGRRTMRLVRGAAYPSWSPAGDKILFGLNQGRDDYYPYVILAGGGLPVAVPRPLGGGALNGSAWSADGRWIALAARSGVYLANPTGKGLRKISATASDALAWSPDQKLIAVAAAGTASAKGVILMRADGTGHSLVYRGPVQSLQWSPKGAHLSFIDLRTGAVRVIDAHGGSQTTFGADLGPIAPVWSPDGKWLAFSTYTSLDPGSVYVVRPDGGKLRKLHSGTDPAWRPCAD
jgi:Tol biopolymer transport system component